MDHSTPAPRTDDPVELFEFDFSSASPPPKTGQTEHTLENPGRDVRGLAQWIKLQFAPDIIYENNPGGDACLHWQINLTPSSSTTLENGGPGRVGGWYSNASPVVWVEAVEN